MFPEQQIRKIILAFFICAVFVSCKPPLPIYFDLPIGTKVQGFDTTIAGNYIPLDDVIERGTKEFSEKYDVGYDKIVLKGFSVEVNGKELNYEDLKTLAGLASKDSTKKEFSDAECDSLFDLICDFNSLASAKLGSRIDKMGPSNARAAMVKISYDRIFFITVDSAGNNSRDTLLSLDQKIILTKYSGKYFLNFKNDYGWEIMQLDVWENKFLSVRPFYFASYNGCSKSISELTASTKNIYPDLKPILNKEKKVVGYKAILAPKLLLEKFKKSEESVMLMKVK